MSCAFEILIYFGKILCKVECRLPLFFGPAHSYLYSVFMIFIKAIEFCCNPAMGIYSELLSAFFLLLPGIWRFSFSLQGLHSCSLTLLSNFGCFI